MELVSVLSGIAISFIVQFAKQRGRKPVYLIAMLVILSAVARQVYLLVTPIETQIQITTFATSTRWSAVIFYEIIIKSVKKLFPEYFPEEKNS